MQLVKKILTLSVLLLLSGCAVLNKPFENSPTSYQNNENKRVTSAIDLVNVKNDHVEVHIQPAPLTTDVATFYIPETVPGTYSDDDYGKFIDSLSAYNSSGKNLKVTRTSDNTWQINNAKTLDHLTYYVNDTFDTESTHEVFSPAGTNFKTDTQYMLNLHAMLGYFKEQQELPYYVHINRPETMEATTSLPAFQDTQYMKQDFETTGIIDTYKANRYFDIIDNPIMYNAPNKEIFKIDDITIALSVYSPTGRVKATDLKPNVEKMMRAQKRYLGDFNATDRYNILLYLSNGDVTDAQGYGALEHHTSTVVVLPETMPRDRMDQAIIDVVAHEFFHIVTPLNLHATQIHTFKYNDPEMSMHLWMYEGITEYFAQHFQVQQSLVTPEEFYKTIIQKIENAKMYDSTLSFTEMSARILEEPFASSYGNVYEKGALIGMCLDILMRKNSNGEMGVLDLMKELTSRYGPDKPFEDSALIPQITQMTSPEIGTFFENHVIGTTPIQYTDFFDLVGLDYNTTLVDTGFFLDSERPFINGNQGENTIYFLPGKLNTFLENIGIRENDIIKSVNGKDYNLTNANDLIMASSTWKEGDNITFVVQRGDEDITLKGSVIKPQVERASLTELNLPSTSNQIKLRNAWLKGQ